MDTTIQKYRMSRVFLTYIFNSKISPLNILILVAFAKLGKQNTKNKTLNIKAWFLI